MVRIRIDDVLCYSKPYANREFGKFRRIHNWVQIAGNKAIHVPTILVSSIQQYPEAVAFIKEQTEAKTMQPAIHGLEHVDYASLDRQTIKDHLDICMEWFLKELNLIPAIFASPWGGTSPELESVVKSYGLVLETCQNTMSPGKACELLRSNSLSENATVLDHWWQKGSRIKRICLSLKYGSWLEAKELHPEEF